MELDTTGGITALLREWRRGDRDAGDRALRRVYPRLEGRARGVLSRWSGQDATEPASLVSDAVVRLHEHRGEWGSQTHFINAAGREMQRELRERARSRKRAKRGGGEIHLPVDAVQDQLPGPVAAIEETVCEALGRLLREFPLGAAILRLHCVEGLTLRETANELGVSERTVGRRWRDTKRLLATWFECDE